MLSCVCKAIRGRCIPNTANSAGGNAERHPHVMAKHEPTTEDGWHLLYDDVGATFSRVLPLRRAFKGIAHSL